MGSKYIIAIAIILAIILIGEAVFFGLVRSGKIDAAGFKARQERKIKGVAWGINGLKNKYQTPELGSFWVQVDLHWQEVDEKGWQPFSQRLADLDTHQIIVTIYSDSKKETVCPQKNAISSCPPIVNASYKEFVGQAVEKAGGKVKFWQIEDRALNSGNYWLGNKEQYLSLLKSGFEAIKSQDQDSQVLLTGLALGNLDVNNLNAAEMKDIENNVSYIFSEGKNYFDIVDLHLFSTLESIQPRVAWLEKKMKDQNFLKPIWSLETGGPDLSAAEYTEDLQAQEIIKRYMLGYEVGLEKILYYHWQDEEAGQIDPLSATLGLNNSGGVGKLALSAFSHMVNNLQGFSHLKRLKLDQNAVGYQLSFSSKSPVFVFWSEDKIKLTLPAEIQESVSATNYLGEPVSFSNGVINLDSRPIYVKVN